MFVLVFSVSMYLFSSLQGYREIPGEFDCITEVRNQKYIDHYNDTKMIYTNFYC